jgi:hypothetical protein
MYDTPVMSEDQLAPPGRRPTCGYSLRGLAPSGICPESGVTYNPDTVHLLQPWPPWSIFALRIEYQRKQPTVVVLSGVFSMVSAALFMLMVSVPGLILDVF